MKIRDWWMARPRRTRTAVAAASAAAVVAIVAGSAVAGTGDGGGDHVGLAHAALDARAAAATSTSSTSVQTTTTSSTTSTSTTAPPAPAAQVPAPAATSGGTTGASSRGACDPYCSTITDVPPPADSEMAQRVEETGSAVEDYDGRYQVDQSTGEVVDTGNASRAVAETAPVTVLTTP